MVLGGDRPSTSPSMLSIPCTVVAPESIRLFWEGIVVVHAKEMGEHFQFISRLRVSGQCTFDLGGSALVGVKMIRFSQRARPLLRSHCLLRRWFAIPEMSLGRFCPGCPHDGWRRSKTRDWLVYGHSFPKTHIKSIASQRKFEEYCDCAVKYGLINSCSERL